MYLTLNKSGKNAPVRLRPDFRAAVSIKSRLHRESGEQVEEPTSPEQYRKCLTFSVCLSFTLLFSSHFYLYSDLHSFFHVNSAKGNIRCAFAQWGVLLRGDIPPSHRLWAQRPWRLPLLADCRNDLPGGIQRQGYGALVLMWLGTRRWDHRAIFTTVHSGTRRTSGPKTSLSFSWRKFVVSSVLFHTHTRTGRPVHELSSCRQKPSREMENETIRILLERQKRSKFLLILGPRFRNTNFKPILIEEVSRNWTELSNLSEEKLIILLQVMNNFDEINYYFMNDYQKKSGSSWSSYEKSLWDGRIEVSSRVKIRWIFEKKIDRKSRHYSWTRGQNSETTEWR